MGFIVFTFKETLKIIFPYEILNITSPTASTWTFLHSFHTV